MGKKKCKIKIYNKSEYNQMLNICLLALGLICFWIIIATFNSISDGEKIGAVLIFGSIGSMLITASIMYFRNRNKEIFRDEIIECDKFEILEKDYNER